MAETGFGERRFPDGRVLRVCAGEAGSTISAIGRELGITRQGASKVVAELRDRGYVVGGRLVDQQEGEVGRAHPPRGRLPGAPASGGPGDRGRTARRTRGRGVLCAGVVARRVGRWGRGASPRVSSSLLKDLTLGRPIGVWGGQSDLTRSVPPKALVPQWWSNERMDLIAMNQLGRGLYSPLFENPQHPPNNARFVFLEEKASRRYYIDWEQGADDNVASLRGYVGKHPNSKPQTDLIGELATRSDAFRVRWSSHNVRQHRTGLKRVHHPVVGDLELHYEALDLPSEPGGTCSPSATSPTLRQMNVSESSPHGRRRFSMKDGLRQRCDKKPRSVRTAPSRSHFGEADEVGAIRTPDEQRIDAGAGWTMSERSLDRLGHIPILRGHAVGTTAIAVTNRISARANAQGAR